jgi:hypothetical protein
MGRSRSGSGGGTLLVRLGVASPLILATALAGCGGPAPPPVKEGRSAYSYDDDEIDPANLRPPEKQSRSRGRR